MSRYNRYSRYRNSGMGLSIFIFVIVLAIATGYAGTKYVVFPYLLNNPSENSTEEIQDAGEATSGSGIDVISSLPSIIIDQQDVKDLSTNSAIDTSRTTVNLETANTGDASYLKGPFSVQFGSFSTKEGAESLSYELTQKGIYSYVYESGGNHKVLGLPYADKEKAQEAARIVSAAVTDVFVVDLASLIK